mmetsp:Transcript_53571/g.160326  ORF Transcript_53571/g.160326 Transcript_53571/m.160326 type:complete len:84 (+) Transcript_53571:221-472(+)
MVVAQRLVSSPSLTFVCVRLQRRRYGLWSPLQLFLSWRCDSSVIIERCVSGQGGVLKTDTLSNESPFSPPVNINLLRPFTTTW